MSIASLRVARLRRRSSGDGSAARLSTRMPDMAYPTIPDTVDAGSSIARPATDTAPDSALTTPPTTANGRWLMPCRIRSLGDRSCGTGSGGGGLGGGLRSRS